MDNSSLPHSPPSASSSSPLSANKPLAMSLESALDEERRSVINMLEGRSETAGSPQPRKDRNASPQHPVRSMLDVSSGPIPRHGSIAGIGVGITAGASPTSSQSVQSMVGTSGETKAPPHRQSHSALFGLTADQAVTTDTPRSPSKDSTHSSQGLPRVPETSKKDFDQNYQFGMLPSIANQALPKRVTQGGVKKERSTSGAMAAAISGDLSTFPGLARGRDARRHNSTVGIGEKSKSPSSRIVNSTQLPGASSANTNSPGLLSAGTYVTDSGKVINMDRAYKKLSDAAIAKSGGSFPTVTSTESAGFDRFAGVESEEASRLAKDHVLVDDGDEAAVESSDDDDDQSSEDETWRSEAARGRGRRQEGSASSGGDWYDSEGGSVSTLGLGKGRGPREAKSLSAAADQERAVVASKYESRSLLEPTISVTSPSGEKMSAKKSSVHPNTSFDHPDSAFTSANSSDDEDVKDVKRAQKLSINISGLDTSIPSRVIRTILRGDFAKMQEEVDDGRRRQRTYVVATDLSDEAVYSLEWTIGTILRDSDTLLAIYAIDEAGAKGSEADSRYHEVGEGVRAAQDTMHTMASQTEKTKTRPLVVAPTMLAASSFLPATESRSHTGSVDSRMMSKAELDRLHAIEDISQTCIRLLRKTRLQVRIVVEVIHTKSPKHMITEAIDVLEPTMAVLGSRGRNALKGVLLGSFSNYLVTKSSKPVMVARKKLKKHAKFKPSKVRLANNLTNPKRIVTAKVD